MRSEHKIARARRRSRRTTLTTAGVCAGVVLGIVATTGVVAAPLSAPDASGLSAVFAASPVAVGADAAASGVRALTTSTDEAEDALSDARDAQEAATALDAEISASGLDLGDDTANDTTALDAAIEALADADVVPVLLFPDLAADAVAATRTVEARTVELQSRLDAARAEKAAADAAAAAAAEAQRQAEEAAAALARANTPDGAKETARQLASSTYGWGGDQFSCLVSLWQKESNWNYQAFNASSGATGIPQALPGSKMGSAGADWQTNAATQIAWGLDYISRAYGTPCSAWGHSQATNWY